MPGANTPFSPLWIDRPDATAVLENKIAAGDLVEEIVAVTQQPDKFVGGKEAA